MLLLRRDAALRSFCKCGCGKLTSTAKVSNCRRGVRAGQPLSFLPGHQKTRPTLSRFTDKYVAAPNGCWEWVGARNKDGYGVLYSPERGYNVGAHRVSFGLFKGGIPDGMLVRHTCDNPSCVNPDHLLAGTIADNVQDQVDRCRQARGVAKPASVLNPDKVRRIRVLLRSSRHTQEEIGRMFCVSGKTISSIARRQTWGWVI